MSTTDTLRKALNRYFIELDSCVGPGADGNMHFIASRGGYSVRGTVTPLGVGNENFALTVSEALNRKSGHKEGAD